VPCLVADRGRWTSRSGGKEALHQVVDAPVPVPARDPRIPASASASRIARTGFVGRQYQSIASRGSTSVDESGPIAANTLQELLHERRVLVERRVVVPCTGPLPGQPVERELRRGEGC